MSPKAADKVVVLKAKPLQAGQNFNDFYQWQVDGQNKAARADGSLELSRADAKVFDVVLLDKRQNVVNKELDHWKVWIVWADGTQTVTEVTKQQNGQPVPNDCFVYAANETIDWAIEPAALFTPGADVPELLAQEGISVPAPNVPAGTDVVNNGINLAGGASKFLRIDSSRQIRSKVINTANINLSSYKNELGNPLYETHEAWPDDATGNDDADRVGEDNNPYDAPHQIGHISSDDNPLMKFFNLDAVPNDKLEIRWHFREFARMELGGKWYRISDFKLWRMLGKVKENVNNKWVDDGSLIEKDNHNGW